MENKRSIIISALIGLVVLALIIGTIYYLIRFITSRPGTQTTRTPNPTAFTTSPTPIKVESPAPGEPTSPSTTTPANTKSFQGRGFTFNYPANWGILTCNNSGNFELDPINSRDQLKVACDYALKPITVLVNSQTCTGGENINKGGVLFNKITNRTSTGIEYKWCTKTNPPLEISHRVSSNNGRATSRQDFSAQVEEMIGRIKFQ